MMDEKSSDVESPPLTVEENSSDSNTDPESLVDATSSKFNPLIALHCEEEVLKGYAKESPRYLHIFELEKAIPDPTQAPVKKSNITLNQKYLFEQAQRQAAASSKAGSTKNEADGMESSAKPATSMKPPPAATLPLPVQDPKYPIPGRKFLAHQLPVYRPPKEHPNVLKMMETVEGPQSAIRKAVNTRQRVIIWTRTVAGIRGYCTACILAFDRHWNLALRDVWEIFQRKRCLLSKESSEKQREGNSRQEEYQHFRTGDFLRDVSTHNKNKETQNVNKTVQAMKTCGTTPIMIQGSDAHLLFRQHSARLASKGFQISIPSSKACTTKLSSRSTDCETEKPVCNSAQLRKKRLTIFDEPLKDPFGFTIVARSQHYEVVERFQKQLYLVGNEIAFIETNL